MKCPQNTSGASADASGNASVGGRGRGFVIIPGGSNPGSYPITVTPQNADKTGNVVVPGPFAFYFDEAFSALLLSGATAGSTWLVYIFTSEAEFIDVAGMQQSLGTSVTRDIHGPSGAATQAAASAAGNVPVLATDGSSLAGASGLRGIFSAAAGQTITVGGTARLWLYDATLARWTRNQAGVDYTFVGGSRDECTLDLEVLVPADRYYWELANVPTSAGALVVSARTARQ